MNYLEIVDYVQCKSLAEDPVILFQYAYRG